MSYLARVISSSVLVFGLVFQLGCQESEPETLEQWLAYMPEIGRDEARLAQAAEAFREKAAERFRKDEDLSHLVSKVVPLLEGRPVVRRQAAWFLGEIADPATVKPLAEAIDYSVGRGVDAESRATNAANVRIARALGAIGTAETVQPLIQLTRAREQEEVLVAVEALGETGQHSAVARLAELAVDEDVSPFISRRAIEGLGKIGHADAIDALVEMLFKERQGVSFYREASFSVFQLGADTGPRLIEILEGKDEEFFEWASGRGIRSEAVYAKAAQILGDLADSRAAPGLMRLLDYDSDYVDLRLIPRMFAAEALGRIRHQPAARKLVGMLDEDDSTTRQKYIQAIMMIGDRTALNTLFTSVMATNNYNAREYSLRGIALLGGPGTLTRFDSTVERATVLTDCTSRFRGPEDKIKEQCSTRIDALKTGIAPYRAMLVAAEECQKNFDCWVEKLSDENPRIREKAAWELSWMGEDRGLTPLLAAAQEPDPRVRQAIILALDTLLFGQNNEKVPSREEGSRAIDRLRSILENERGRAQFVRINEDLRRLELRVARSFMERDGEIN